MALRRHAMPLEFTIACFAAPSFHEGSGSVADAASASAETGKKGEDRIANATKSASKMRSVMPEGESFLRHPERGRSAANDHASKLEAGHASNGSRDAMVVAIPIFMGVAPPPLAGIFSGADKGT
jgi:hypothetical protein